MIFSTSLWETGGIPSAITNDEGVRAVTGGWLNSLVDRITGGSPDSDRVRSTGSLGHERIFEAPVMIR